VEKIRFIDTFAGIGGFHRGIIQALGDENAECVGAVEWDKNARQAYSTNFPDVHVYEDITKLNYDELPDHDLLTGGFPCQPFSIARNKNNKTVVDDNDDRAQLYKSLVAICKAKRPKYIFFENVARLVDMTTSDNTPVIDLIKNELGELGYNVIYGVLDSKEFGAPQQRKRVFILGTTTDQQLKLPESFGEPQTIEDILEDDNKVDDKYLLTNKNWCKLLLKNEEGTRLDKLEKNYLYNPEKNGKKINRVSEVNGDTPSGLSRQNERLYSIHGVSPTLTTFFPPHVDMGSDDRSKWRSLTPRECLRVQGFPDKHIPHPKDQAAYKQTGNAVCVNVIQAIVSHNKENFLSGVRSE
jgi:DNA (cytosine-5)-methyltransferase 1